MSRAWVSSYGGFTNGIRWWRVNGWPLGIGVWIQNTTGTHAQHRALRVPLTPYRVKLLLPRWEYRYARSPVYGLAGGSR